MLALKVPSARSKGGSPAAVAKASAGEGMRIAAVKRRDRLRLFTGLAAMVVCALLFGAVAVATGQRSEVLALARPVSAGQVLTNADVKSVLVSANAGAVTIAASRQGQVVGQRANASLPAGLLLSEGLFGQGPTQPGTAVVTLALKEGRYPPTLGAGDRVAVYETHPSATGSPTAGTAASTASVEAMTLDVRSGSGPSGGAVAMVRVAAGQVGQLVADQEPAVVLLGGEATGSGR
ncbi:SAF domain-containing protein [Streptomyces tateyamensis]|nr:SAF domain-containing protein [Streptomyces tateyamensis]